MKKKKKSLPKIKAKIHAPKVTKKTGGNTGRGGGQFGNNNAEDWTEEDALMVANGLLKWMKKKNINMFFQDFLFIDNDYPANIIENLSNKFDSFRELINKARKIQEVRVIKLGITKRAAMPIFVLKNNHGWKDRKEVELKDERKIKPEDEVLKRINELKKGK